MNRYNSGNFSYLSGFVLIITIILAWQFFSDAGWLFRPYFPPPSKVLTVLLQNLTEESSYKLSSNLMATLFRVGGGYLLSAGIAIPLGMVIGYHKAAYRVLEPLLEFLRPLPPVAVAPIFILLLGIGDSMYIPFVAFGCLWPILVNTIDGVRSIDRTLMDTANLFRISGSRRFVKVILPAASPFVISGLRVSLSLALLLAIVVEMIAGRNGIGYTTLYSQQTSDIPALYGQMFIVSMVGLVLNRAFLKIEATLMVWHKLLSIS